MDTKRSLGLMLLVFLCLAQLISCGDSIKPGEDLNEDVISEDTNEDITGEDTVNDEEVDPCTGLACSGTTPHCCEGECRECCDDVHCNDANDCTLDSCNAGTCVHQPVADRTACEGGICCVGTCRTGGQCCSSADCVEGCKGTEVLCGGLSTQDECITQRGCTWSGPGSCAGGVLGCLIFGYSSCPSCPACEWTGGICLELPSYTCETVDNELDCRACACTWIPRGCVGTHEPCSSNPNEDLCHEQLDCYWSVCVNYVCT
jgi:hypothetical protein